MQECGENERKITRVQQGDVVRGGPGDEEGEQRGFRVARSSRATIAYVVPAVRSHDRTISAATRHSGQGVSRATANGRPLKIRESSTVGTRK